MREAMKKKLVAQRLNAAGQGPILVGPRPAEGAGGHGHRNSRPDPRLQLVEEPQNRTPMLRKDIVQTHDELRALGAR